jgi:hypothetical protein
MIQLRYGCPNQNYEMADTLVTQLQRILSRGVFYLPINSLFNLLLVRNNTFSSFKVKNLSEKSNFQQNTPKYRTTRAHTIFVAQHTL